MALFNRSNRNASPGRGRRGGFTFAELLAAMVFLAVVVPVALEGYALASRSSVLSQRKTAAVRLAERLIGENAVTGDWRYGIGRGDFAPAWPGYRWELIREPWTESGITALHAVVYFPVQGIERYVRLTTLVPEEDTASEGEAES